MTKKYSILISYLIGAPIGLITVALVFVLPAALSGEGLATMAMAGLYGKAIIGLIVAFLISLGIGGKKAFDNLSKNNRLITASFKYSLLVNLIIWSTFICITIIDASNTFSFLYLVPAIFAFIVSVLGTTITIGLLICYLIKLKINKNPVID